MSLFFFVAGFFARMLFQRGGARGFWANRAKRILVPLVAGWVSHLPGDGSSLDVGADADVRRHAAGAAGRRPCRAARGVSVDAPVVPVLPARALRDRAGRQRRPVGAIDRSGSLTRAADASCRGDSSTPVPRRWLLALPVALALYLRREWIVWFGIPTPDHSVIPELASLVGYGTALAFGWMIHRQADLLAVWPVSGRCISPGRSARTAVCLWLAGIAPAFVPSCLRRSRNSASRSPTRSAIWCWRSPSSASQPGSSRRPTPRSGTSPMLPTGSTWCTCRSWSRCRCCVGRLPWHWAIKFPLILVVSLAVLFASYRYLVRSTFIGQLLNGRKYPRDPIAASGFRRTNNGDPRSAPGRPLRRRCQRTPLATLNGVHKRYGKTVALAGLDLEVRSGELLAVLGPNGAGKSTAISLWLGLLEADGGEVQLLGGSPLDVESRRHVGVMMQEVGLTPELRVRELIDLTASYYPKPLTAGADARR